MRDVLLVVAILGGLGMMFILALAATKYGEAIQKDLARRTRGEAGVQGDDASEPSTRHARPGWQREVSTGSGYLAIALILLAGMAIGQVVSSALDVSGVRQILISSAAIFILCWCVLGALIFRLKPSSRR